MWRPGLDVDLNLLPYKSAPHCAASGHCDARLHRPSARQAKRPIKSVNNAFREETGSGMWSAGSLRMAGGPSAAPPRCGYAHDTFA
jgi:hypothetical protein